MKRYSYVMEYLSGLENTGIIFGLDNINWILDAIGNPHERLNFIHIAGTNGKGSVATMVSSILKNSGYKVGKYTSPHLIRFNERVVVDEKEISDSEVEEIGDFIIDRVEKQKEKKRFSYFDFTTAMAFEYFYRQKVEIAVVEVGLGGRLDSTNVIKPLLSIITNVDIDHTDYLGSSVEEIAKEKAGIIKKGVPVITGADGIALEVIEKKAIESESPLYSMGRDFSFKKIKEQTGDFLVRDKIFKNVFVNLKGEHQLFNASLAICTISLLKEMGFNIEDHVIYSSLAQIEWAGRLEMVRKRPEIILDGAHNLQAIKALVRFLKEHYKEKKKVIILGVMADKDYEGMLREIVPEAHTLIFTKAFSKRALSPYELAKYVDKCYITDNVFDALKKAKNIACEDDLILITGSLYIVGEAKKLLDEVF
ncbi:MAG: bifunctional folylpolyglutamate synthase/dihydrofolate synthase [Syntrophorhabdaceae bacterium]|nr:bifunctional folylpolyglutamate synthase/dihydrofolate synthase [Syntrophorhabdaceae bacterium]